MIGCFKRGFGGVGMTEMRMGEERSFLVVLFVWDEECVLMCAIYTHYFFRFEAHNFNRKNKKFPGD